MREGVRVWGARVVDGIREEVEGARVGEGGM